MKAEHDHEMQALRRDMQMKSSERERELLVMRSEAARKRETQEDEVLQDKKAHIKLQQELLDA